MFSHSSPKQAAPNPPARAARAAAPASPVGAAFGKLGTPTVNQTWLRLATFVPSRAAPPAAPAQPPVSAAPIQRKVAVSAPGDAFEREADRAAEQVMAAREPAPKAACAGACSAPGGCGGNCGGAAKTPGATPPAVQMKRLPDSAAAQAAVPSSVHQVLRSGGQPLDRSTRTFMESGFGHDFGGVRVHTGGAAAASAGEMHALAYTVGRDIVFGSSQYAPGTEGGRTLLAHELAHVVQQSGTSSLMIQRKDAPGTNGKSAEGCFVVYDSQIKVNGKPCWRLNNPGNVGPFPSVPTAPAGSLGTIKKGPPCGAAKIEMFIFDTPTSGMAEVSARVDQGARKARFVCEFLEDFSHEGQKYLDEISDRCTFLKATLPKAADCNKNGPNLGNLTADQLNCIKAAIGDAECGFKTGAYSTLVAGDVFTCATPTISADFKTRLGCP